MLHIKIVLATFLKTLQYRILGLEMSMVGLVEIASSEENPSGESGRGMPSDDPVQGLVLEEIRVGNLEHRRMTISIRKIGTESARKGQNHTKMGNADLWGPASANLAYVLLHVSLCLCEKCERGEFLTGEKSDPSRLL